MRRRRRRRGEQQLRLRWWLEIEFRVEFKFLRQVVQDSGSVLNRCWNAVTNCVCYNRKQVHLIFPAPNG
jgi:hypothetical protein